MHSPNDVFARFFDIGKDILSAAVDKVTNVILCQVGNATDSTADSDSAELWGPPGYYAVPAAPTAGQPSCQSITLKQSDHDIIVGTRDTRDSKIYGNLKPGDRCIAAGFPGQARVLVKETGPVVLMTTSNNTSSGTSITLDLSPNGFHVSTPWGGIVLDATGITLTTGQAALTLSPTGDAKLVGQTALVQGSIAAIAGTVMTTVGNVPPGSTPATAGALHLGPTGPAPSATVLIGP